MHFEHVIAPTDIVEVSFTVEVHHIFRVVPIADARSGLLRLPRIDEALRHPVQRRRGPVDLLRVHERKTLERWRRSVPEDFVFSVKAF
jgi:hypothetical protein